MPKLLTAVAALLLLAPTAAAHPESATRTRSFLDGALHPLSGLDHTLAMVTVGILAIIRGERALWALPMAFVAGMSAGLLAPIDTGLTQAIEIAIATSVFGLGALLAFDARWPLLPTLASVAIAGAAHGAAHSIEGASSHFSAFAAGALTMTGLIHAAGACLGVGLRHARRLSPRILGAGIAAAAVILTMGN